MVPRPNIDVFISHHTSSCLPVTQAICNTFENNGIRCWYAPRDTVGAYAGSISDAIDACRIFILVLNQQSALSYDVLNEINLAVERIRHGEKVEILPFHISNNVSIVNIGADAKYYISRLHWIDAIDPPLEARIIELKQRVETILAKSASAQDPQVYTSHLINSNIFPNCNFIGRTQELDQIQASLSSCNKVFLQGMGGIGKSELAKAYFSQNSNFYNTVVFATYRKSLRDMLIYDPCFHNDNLLRRCNEDGSLESDEAYFLRKLTWLQQVTDKRTLLIIDNFDTSFDKDLEVFLAGSYTVIFTTRNDYEELGLPVVKIEEMTLQEQFALFSHYYRRNIPELFRKKITDIFQLVNGHTLAIELIAKHMRHNRILPDMMYTMLCQQGIQSMTKKNISQRFKENQSGYHCIYQIFNLQTLSPEEIYILENLALVPTAGIEAEIFGELCQLEDYMALDELIRKSWVHHNVSEDIISLHPLIREIVQKEYLSSLDVCSIMLENLTQKLKGLWGAPFEDKLRYVALGNSLYACFPTIEIDHLDLYLAIATGLALLENFDLSDEISIACLTKQSEIYGTHSEETAEIYYRLGSNALSRNNIESAMTLLGKAISILEEVTPNSPRLAFMIKFLCWARLGWSDDHQETERLLHRSNAILSAQKPINQSQMASQQSAYATLYYLTGQYQRGLDFAESAYQSFFKLHGDIHGDTLAPMGIKAKLLSKLGYATESIQLAQYVIEIQVQLSGEHHKKVLSRYEALAEIYENLGNISQAKQALQYVLDILVFKKEQSTPYYHCIAEKYKKLS